MVWVFVMKKEDPLGLIEHDEDSSGQSSSGSSSSSTGSESSTGSSSSNTGSESSTGSSSSNTGSSSSNTGSSSSNTEPFYLRDIERQHDLCVQDSNDSLYDYTGVTTRDFYVGNKYGGAPGIFSFWLTGHHNGDPSECARLCYCNNQYPWYRNTLRESCTYFKVETEGQYAGQCWLSNSLKKTVVEAGEVDEMSEGQGANYGYMMLDVGNTFNFSNDE